jgi:cytosine/adenosine deaminase-related metal-dependent hydrolase
VSLIVIEGCHVATCDADGAEYADGHVVLDGGRIISVGPGRAGTELRDGAEWIDGSGCLATPGLINTHHHLYQWITRGIATDTTLFGWLTTLYPMWARLDEDSVHASAAANLAWMALTGCTTTSDHHYVFPVDGGDLLEAETRAARWISVSRRAGCRLIRSSRIATRSWPRPSRRSTASTTRRPSRCCGSWSRPARRSRSPAA